MAGIDAPPRSDGKIALDPETLKRLRKQLGFSQEALAEHCFDQRLCVSIASIKRAETGKSVLYRTARHLAQVFAVELEALAGCSEAAAPVSGTGAHAAPAAHSSGRRQVIYLSIHECGGLDEEIESALRRTMEAYGGEVLVDGQQAVFGLQRAYLSDALRCLQCAVEVMQLLAGRLTARHACVSVQRLLYPAPLDGGLPPPCDSPFPIVVARELGLQLEPHFEFVGAGPRFLLLKRQRAQPALPGLVGRRRELRQFHALLEAVDEDQSGHVLLLRGVAGIGKTRLATELQELAAQAGFECHAGHVLDFGVKASDDVHHQLLRSLLQLVEPCAGEAAERQLLRQVQALHLPDSYIPFYRAALDLPQPPEQEALYRALSHAVRSQRSAEALRQLVRRKSIIRPQFILIEDIHWGDSLLLDTLTALLPETHEAPILCLLTSRLEHDAFGGALQAGLADVPLSVFELSPLRPAEAEILAQQFDAVDPPWRERCIRQAAGNPLFLTQLLHCEQDGSLPGSLQHLVQVKLDQLSGDDRLALSVAAVLGQRFSLLVLRRVLQRPAYEAAALVAACFLRPLGDGDYLFVHDLIMKGIYASLEPEQRRGLHVAVAAWYEEQDATLHARHLHKAADPRAAAAYQRAIAEKMAAYQYQAALELIAECLSIRYAALSVHPLLLLQGNAASKTGQSALARRAFEAALAEAVTPQQRIEASLGLARTLNVLEELETERQLLEDVLPLARQLGLQGALAEIFYLQGNLYFPRGDFARCRQLHEQARVHALAAGEHQLYARVLSGLGDSYYAEGRMLTARILFQGCLDLCRQHGYPEIEASNRFMLATVRLYVNEIDEAIADAQQSAALGARVGNRRAEVVSRLTAGWLLLSCDRLAEARSEVDSGLELARSLGAARFEPFLQESLARLLWLEGREDEALATIRQAWRSVESQGLNSFIGPWVLGTLALLDAGSSAWRQTLEQGQRLLEQGCVAHNHYRFHLSAAECCLLRGEPELALSYIEHLKHYAEAEPCRWVLYHSELVQRVAEWMQDPAPARHAALGASLRSGADLGLTQSMPCLRRRLRADFPWLQPAPPPV